MNLIPPTPLGLALRAQRGDFTSMALVASRQNVQLRSPLCELCSRPRGAGGIRSFTRAACSALFALFPFFCSATTNLCPTIHGTYTGTYRDTTGLFPDQAFPLKMVLVSQKGKVYGYTLPSDDAKGAGYGQAPYAILFGSCQNSTIRDLYLVKNTPHPCGDPAPGPMPFNQSGPLSLHINYENAMINADLQATLSQQSASISMNARLLQAAITQSKQGIKTCH